MDARESPYFAEFSTHHLLGSGRDAYLLQRRTLLDQEGPQGHFQRPLKLHGKVLIIEYYRSNKLDTLFVMIGRLVEAGKPRDREKEELRACLADIERLEMEADP